MHQFVGEPTRGKYLFDLVLTDALECAARPCAAVADHKGVLTQVTFKIKETATHKREVWQFGDADWERIASNIQETSWDFLTETFPSEGATRFTEELLSIAEENIPKRTASIRKTTHPWLTERGEEAVRRKHAAQGTEQEAVAARECSEILLEEHYDVGNTRSKLVDAKPSSKNWWSNARRLMDKKQRVSNIPALKQGSEWILEPEEKANCFVSSFEAKNQMSDAEANEYSDIAYTHPIFFCGLPTVEATEKELASLDEDSALGPDLVPTRILKRCAKVLAPVLHLLILEILKFGEWPSIWREHWVVETAHTNLETRGD